MASSSEFIEARLQATRDAQVEVAAVYVWEEMTVAQWIARALDFTAKQAAAATQEGVMLNKRATFEASIVELHDLTVSGLKMGRVKWRNDAARKAILSTLHAEGDSRDAVEKEAQAWAAVWASFDAAWVPTPGDTLVAFNVLLATCFTQENEFKQEHTQWRELAEEFNVFAAATEELCIAWYAAVTTVFPEGTSQGDMIRSTVPTTYVPPPAGAPHPLEITSVQDLGGGQVRANYGSGGETATVLQLQWEVVGVSPGYSHVVTVVRPQQTVAAGVAGNVVRFRTMVSNANGEVFSIVRELTLG